MITQRGRPPIYAERIYAITPEDGWVAVCTQANRTAPSGYRTRYPGYDFRCVPIDNAAAGTKPFMLEAKKLEDKP
jgi:hypothetical protein